MPKLFWSVCFLTMITSCQDDQARYIGQEETCGNGYYYNLGSLQCERISGFFLEKDSFAQDRLQTDQGLRVPTKINGQAPFMVSFYYNVDFDATKFEVALRRIEDHTFLNPVYSDWKEVYVDQGEGWQDVRITLPQTIEPGPAINQINGHWLQSRGWLIEIKGGDPNEDQDRDNIEFWRSAGIEVDEQISDDLTAKQLILGSIETPEFVESCELITGSFFIEKLEFSLTAIVALKQPGLNWKDWGSSTLSISKGYTGSVPFEFTAQNEQGECPPAAGPAKKDAAGLYSGEGYLLQIDFFDESGNRLDLNRSDYTYRMDSTPIEVTHAKEEASDVRRLR